MRKPGLAILLVAVVVFGVVASGCLGGGNGGTSRSPSTSSSSESASSTSGSGGSSGAGGGSETTESSGAVSATWETPWDAYDPVMVNGEGYYITYIRYAFTVKTPEGTKTYEVEKRRGYVKAHVYSDENGQKKDLGEFNLFAYYERMTPLNGSNMTGPFEYLIAVRDRTKETDQWFLNPLPNLGALGTGGAVIAEARSGSDYFYWSNPAALGRYSELPYKEGDLDSVLGDIGEYIGQAWTALLGSGAWSGLEGHDLMKKDQYSFSFMGMEYSYKIEPDGTVTLDGKTFRVSNVKWSYSAMGATLRGRATIAPALPVPIETEGTFASLSTGAKGYSRLKLEGIKLEREFTGIDVSIEKPNSAGEGGGETGSQSSTESQTETESPSGGSNNWRLAWDASKPLTINGKSYTVREVTYDITYRLPGNDFHYTLTKGYKALDKGYEVYALAKLDDGSEYDFRVYTNELGEYTGWVLWVPSVFQLLESGEDYTKETISGPSCSYEIDSDGNFQGDPNCGAQIRGHPLDGIWDVFNGFAGGVYGDVVEVTSLSGSGGGYSVSKDGSTKLGSVTFQLYNVTWSGSWMGGPANGYTLLAEELPFPVEIAASFGNFEGGAYLHVKLIDIKLESQ
ncbi:hypothetical protein [Thermococcus sp.]|uniref:hypothetical protein n=1 Tax=Thermococcus sp. TaxID=35749 RepID=UPI00260D8CE8|nr:hypothetical protein [Thermococcus sp.]